MKKKLTYTIIVMQIIIILINLIYPFNVCFADGLIDGLKDNTMKKIYERMNEMGKQSVEDAIDGGTATITNSSGQSSQISLGITDNSSETLIGVICGVFVIIPSITNFFMIIVVELFQLPSSGNIRSYFTIEDLVLNKYTVFDINFLDRSKAPNNTTIGELRENIAIWYYSLRNVAVVANCIILIYIGIRMAISTVATDRAKYKKMLINWLTSMILLYGMHYIIVILFSLQDYFIDLIKTMVEGDGFEEEIMKNTFKAVRTAKGWDMVSYIVIIYAFAYYELKFFFMYFKRTLSIAFLFVISPLITITYAIDAVKDGKSQVYNKWFKEISYNIFIQSIHAIVYAVFIMSAGEIARQAPIMGAIMLMSLSRAEKIIEKTLKLSSRITRSESLIEKIKTFGKSH